MTVAVRFTARKLSVEKISLSTAQTDLETRRTPMSVWTIEKKYLSFCWESNPGHAASSLVTILTELSQVIEIEIEK
jgi:hypothetical protein